ncbi:MAG TPA: transposase [Mycobacterium sp.]
MRYDFANKAPRSSSRSPISAGSATTPRSAKLAGTSPIEANSGQTVRHRLNRGGDRALNRAIHTIAVTRMRSCTRTRAYVERRTADGKSSREIRRAIKRYITRKLYLTLNAAMTG